MPVPADRKGERLNLRVSRREKETLERASSLLRVTTSQFVVREALAVAEEILGDRTRFELPQKQWSAFIIRLDEPPRELPAIKRLLTESSPFGD